MQSVSSRIWTRVAVSISYDDNHYTTGTPQKVVMIEMHVQWLSLLRLIGCVKCRLRCHKSWHRLLLLYQAWDLNVREKEIRRKCLIFSNAAWHSGVQLQVLSFLRILLRRAPKLCIFWIFARSLPSQVSFAVLGRCLGPACLWSL